MDKKLVWKALDKIKDPMIRAYIENALQSQSEVERLTEENQQNANYAEIYQDICDKYGKNFGVLLDKAKTLLTENAKLKKALELACFELAVSSCPCSLVDGCDTCPDEKQGDPEGATREKRESCWEKYFIHQADQLTHESNSTHDSTHGTHGEANKDGK